MAQINNLTSYPTATPVANSIVIGSIASGDATNNFLMSDISTFVLGNAVTPTLDDVCQQGASTTTGITVAGTTTLNGTVDINNTADISDTLTLSKASGTGLAVTASATIGGRLTITGTGLGNGLVVSGDGSVGGTFGVVGTTTLNGALDANSTADIADTLTLSKATGTGLQVDANAIIDGNIAALGDGGVGGTLTVVGTTTLMGALDANSTADIDGTLTVVGVTTLNGLVLTDTAPASASASGIAGQISVDANYIYVCTATNTWKRVAVATW